MIGLRHLALLLALAGAAPAAQPQENVPLGEAQRQLRDHIARLEGWRTAADTLYEKQAGATVDGALKAKGVDWARRYAGDWGGWVYTTWSGVRLYRIHREVLDQSLGVVANQGYAKPAQLEYLSDGMNALSREHDNLTAKMNEYLALLGDRGAVLDKINALPQGASAAARRALEERRDGLDLAIEKLKAGSIAPYHTKQVFHSLASLAAGPRRFIVDRLDIRSAWWDAHSRHVRGEIEQAGRQIARHQRAMDKEFADLKTAGARADEATARKHKARAQLDAARAEIDRLKRAGLALPPQLQTTLQRRDDEYVALVLEEDKELRKVKDAAVYVQVSMDYINRFKEERARLEKEGSALTAVGAPVLEAVTVSTDAGKVVFRAERAASAEEVRKVEAELAETEEAVGALKEAKDELFAAFRAKVEEGNAYLRELHGNISQGTGAWSALSNLFSGGAIMNNARNQAMIDGAVILWEFAEAGVQGGPAMILADAMNKLVMEGLKKPWPANATNASPLDVSELLKTGIYRTMEDGIVRHGREGAYESLEKWRTDRLRRAYQDAAIKSRGSSLTYVHKMLDPATSAADLKKQGAIFNENRRKLLELGKALAKEDLRKPPPAYGAGSLATNVARDALKAVLGHISHQHEYERWKAFAIAASMQPGLYNAYTIAADRYWPAYDRLQEMRKKRDALARGFDPYSGFTIRSREAFDDQAKLRIALAFRQPKGHQEDVLLGKVQARPNPANEHEHSLSADSLPGAGTAQAPTRLDLLVRHKEPKRP